MKYSIELLEINLKYHKEQIKKYSKPIASSNDYIQNLLKNHIELKNDLEKSLNLIKRKENIAVGFFDWMCDDGIDFSSSDKNYTTEQLFEIYKNTIK